MQQATTITFNRDMEHFFAGRSNAEGMRTEQNVYICTVLKDRKSSQRDVYQNEGNRFAACRRDG